jgi:hypothetical protein
VAHVGTDRTAEAITTRHHRLLPSFLPHDRSSRVHQGATDRMTSSMPHVSIRHVSIRPLSSSSASLVPALSGSYAYLSVVSPWESSTAPVVISLPDHTSSMVESPPPLCYTRTPSALRTSSSLSWEALALWCMPTVSCIHPIRLPRTSSGSGSSPGLTTCCGMPEPLGVGWSNGTSSPGTRGTSRTRGSGRPSRLVARAGGIRQSVQQFRQSCGCLSRRRVRRWLGGLSRE